MGGLRGRQAKKKNIKVKEKSNTLAAFSMALVKIYYFFALFERFARKDGKNEKLKFFDLFKCLMVKLSQKP